MKIAAERADEALYKKHLESLVKYSNEKQILTDKILEAFQPDKSMSFLDIGAGDGAITFRIAEHVGETTAIELNPELCDVLRANNNIKVIEQAFEDANLKKYDLVLASHVMYYFECDRWVEMAGKMHEALNPNGKLSIIVFADSGGFYDLYKSFYPEERLEAHEQTRSFVHNLQSLDMDPLMKVIETKFIMPMNIALDTFGYFSGIDQSRTGELENFFEGYVGDNGKVELSAHHNMILVEK